jgi:hypothetical protein
LRDLQRSVNAMLSHAQKFTANPKTNSRSVLRLSPKTNPSERVLECCPILTRLRRTRVRFTRRTLAHAHTRTHARTHTHTHTHARTHMGGFARRVNELQAAPCNELLRLQAASAARSLAPLVRPPGSCDLLVDLLTVLHANHIRVRPLNLLQIGEGRSVTSTWEVRGCSPLQSFGVRTLSGFSTATTPTTTAAAAAQRLAGTEY